MYGCDMSTKTVSCQMYESCLLDMYLTSVKFMNCGNLKCQMYELHLWFFFTGNVTDTLSTLWIVVTWNVFDKCQMYELW